jgi:hypothetical protein
MNRYIKIKSPPNIISEPVIPGSPEPAAVCACALEIKNIVNPQG